MRYGLCAGLGLGLLAAGAGFGAGAATTSAAPSDVKPPILIPNTATTTDYTPQAGFPDHNGAFSAMVVVVPQRELTEFDKPSGSTRQLDRVAKAEAGAVLAIKLVFIGMKPDYYNQANVSYDLQVIAPDGKIYGDSDYKGLDALHGQLGDEDGVFDNRNKVVLMQFEPQDMPGVYIIKAVLHDNNAKLDLPVQTHVELMKKPDPAPVTPGSVAPFTAAPTMVPVPDMPSAPVRKIKRHRRHRHH